MTHLPIQTLSSAALLLFGLASCGGAGDPTADTATAAADAAGKGMPAALWSATPIEGAKEVRDLREAGQDGDSIVVRGTLQEFGELATFRLVDDALEDCSESGDDGCTTPWDYCCTDPDELYSMTMNVEFQGEDGIPKDWSLKGEHGLDLLTEVVVAGTFRKDEAGNMRVEATRMSLQTP